MNYEKKYKDALERAKKWRNAPNVDKIPTYANRVIEEIFPELKESEDERIRKELIDAVQGLWDNDALPLPLSVRRKNEWLAWLNKQESVGEIVERCKTSWYNEGKIQGQIEGLSDDEKYQQGWHDALEKQGEQKADCSEEDEKIRKALIRFHKTTINCGGVKGSDIIAWLEKQGKKGCEE